MRKLYILFIVLIGFQSNAQVVPVTDPAFLQLLLQDYGQFAYDEIGAPMVIDTNGNNLIEVSEAQQVYKLNVPHYLYLTYDSETGEFTEGNPIFNVYGIQYFMNLRELTMTEVPINVGHLLPLTYLERLDLAYSTANTLNLSTLVNLRYLDCTGMGAYDIILPPGLKVLKAGSNSLSEVSYPSSIEELYVDDGGIEFLSISNLSNLKILSCSWNPIINLDLSSSPLLTTLTAMQMSQLQSINLKNGTLPITSLTIANCPSLSFICTDDVENDYVIGVVNSSGFGLARA